MGELKKLRIAGTENTVTPYTAADDTVVITNHTVKVNTNKIATKTELDGKVDKETGKGLSTNDFTTAEKNKLAGIEAQANKTVVDDALSSTSTNPVQNKKVKEALDNLDAGDIAYDDTETYANGTIGKAASDLLADLNELSGSIAPVETSTTATSAHAVGELFLVGETLMVALSAIAVGDTITTEGGSPNAAVTKLTDKLIKDVQVNGTSVLSQGVANVPVATNSVAGVVIVDPNNGVAMANSDPRKITVRSATANQLKAGTNNSVFVCATTTGYAAFYGLAKVAGADEKDSSLPAGQYTDAAKVAIQKMLGIYEAPWELIREDTFTLTEQGNIEISVDDNGQTFELTDVYCVFGLPQQETEASVSSYGRVRFYSGNSNLQTLYMGAWTQAAGAAARSATQLIEQRNGAEEISYTKQTTDNNEPTIQTINGRATHIGTTGRLSVLGSKNIYTKIVFEAITGTAIVKVIGRRKWS